MRSHNVYWDVNGRKAYGDDGKALNNDSVPYIGYKEKIELNLQLINSPDISDVYTGFDGVTIACEAAIKANNTHYYEGALTAAKSGSIVAVTADGFAGEDVYSTGKLQLKNAAGQGETIAYTSYSLVNGVYTFTVSSVLTYSYADNDICRIYAHPLIGVANADIDQTSKATGLFVVTLYAYTLPYQRAVLNKWEVSGARFGFYALDNTSADILGAMFDFRCLTRLVDSAVIPPTPTGNYYTKSESDARYIRTPTSDDIEVTDAAKGLILTTGSQRIRLRIDYTDSVPQLVFDVL